MGKGLLDDRGRVTIPQELRNALRLQPGMEVEVERSGETLIVRRTTGSKETWARLRGCITERNAREPLDPMSLKRIWHAGD